jgi:epoxyqueuosine reductase
MVAENAVTLAERIKGKSRELAFDLVGIAPVQPMVTLGPYRRWLEKDYHGEMAYLARQEAVARRSDLRRTLSGIRSVVAVGVNYYTASLPRELGDDPSRGIISSYAWGSDYHDVLTPRLRQLGAFVEAETGQPVAYRAYVDTGPLLEREIAARAGLGFVGKHTNLIHSRLGSWLFLGELLLTVQVSPARGLLQRASLPLDKALCSGQQTGTCGRCSRCLDACPTAAFVAPYVLDARRCISYLTIELKGPIPRELRSLIGNRIFGCDICQQVCPWNRRFARPTAEPAFQPRPDGMAPRLLDLFALDDEGFRRRFRYSPVKRSKRRGLLRNVAVALGNWGEPIAVPALARALDDAEPLIRGHAAWALGCIATAGARRALSRTLTTEADGWVREELRLAIEAIEGGGKPGHGKAPPAQGGASSAPCEAAETGPPQAGGENNE